MNNRTSSLLRNKTSLIPLFDGIGDGILEKVFTFSKIVKFNEDDIVLKEGKRVDDIYVILSGTCVCDYLCTEGKILRKELRPTDLFGAEGLFLPGILTNKIRAVTELVLLKIEIAALRADQDIIHCLTPNMTRRFIGNLRDSDNHISKLSELIPEPELLEEVTPSIIIDKNSKLTRLQLSIGKIVVVSKIDERRLRRQEVTVNQLNDEHLSKMTQDSTYSIVES